MEHAVTVIAIVQARMGSARFPNKVMKPINGVPMIELLLKRLSNSKQIDRIIVATSVATQNQPLAEHVRALGFDVYQGSENDVLDRFYQAAKQYSPDYVIRITGDCPLIDSGIVDKIVTVLKSENVDYVSNVCPPTYPDGLDTEAFSFIALKTAWEKATLSNDREHVTPFMRKGDEFRCRNVAHIEDCSMKRWTVDEPEDLEIIRGVCKHFHPRIDFSWREVLELQNTEPAIFMLNSQLTRNSGASIGTGQKLWKRAKKSIPGGNMLLSKRAEMFLPDKWPAYFSKAKGCRVWDLDGREFIDMSIMGIGTNILGYGHPEVDEAVIQTVHAGNMSTLNCPEEVYLAEKLIELHPWASMVRLARSGGEANAIAIRIARAATGKDKVAVCGYHGWHDWYLSANLGDDAKLAGHLLPGLDPKGVPQSLRGTVFPFNYNNFDELERLVSANEIGVIKMEVCRNKGPENSFLQNVRSLATSKGIVLVFDECTSGFRETFGGLHKKYGVEPDMAMFGKALGNGYAITAVIGREAIMESAQATFISSTFWTERIGPTAALKTLEVMQREKSWETITKTGSEIARRWIELAHEYNVQISVSGLPALITFSFVGENSLKYKTLLTQEMLKKGYLASTAVYVSTEHTSAIVNSYFESLATVFKRVSECEAGRSIDSLLEGPVCHAGFRRLN